MIPFWARYNHKFQAICQALGIRTIDEKGDEIPFDASFQSEFIEKLNTLEPEQLGCIIADLDSQGIIQRGK